MASYTRKRSDNGSIREVEPGVWYVRVSGGYTRDGKRRRVQRTVRGCEADARTEMYRLAQEMGADASMGDPMRLDDYFWDVFLPEKERRCSNATVTSYSSAYRTYIAPTFGRRDAASITNRDVQRWLDGLPATSAPNYLRAFRAIMNQAHFDGIIGESPFEGYRFKLPRRTRRPLPVWEAHDVATAIVAMRGERLQPIWLLMVGAGLSRSEALAVDWEDVEWRQAIMMDGRAHWCANISVEKALTNCDGMKEPKNDRRYRKAPMQPLFADELHAIRGEGPMLKAKDGSRLLPWSVPKLWKALFAKGGPLEGLPYVELGRMRATYSTLMQQAGVADSIINAVQGRSANSKVLYTHYLNPADATFQVAAESMERVVRNA